MITLWEETVTMILNNPCRKSKAIEFRSIAPQSVIEFMKSNPSKNTISELMKGVNSTKSTIRRIMIHLEENGNVRIDRVTLKGNYLYFLIGD